MQSFLYSNRIVVLALGSNLGEREKNINKAFDALPLAQKIIAPVMQTKALLPKNAPQSWNIDYLNTVVIGVPIFNLQETFCKIKAIEKKMKRQKCKRWAPRIIDIDIILWSKKIIDLLYLQVPHKELKNRRFVLEPLSSVMQLFVHPVYKISIAQMLSNYLRVKKTQ